MLGKNKHKQFSSLLILAIIWLIGAVGDRLWFAFDHSIPAWDQAEYLTSSLNYWKALQQPQWFSSEWWTSFWMLSTKLPPFTQITAAVVQHIFGTGFDQATLVNLLFSAILFGSVYGLGVQLFSVEVGLWAAGLCLLIPSLYQVRLNFLLDYPLTAMVTLSFWCLTVWKARAFPGNAWERGRTAETQRAQRRKLQVDNQSQQFSPSPHFPISPFLWAVAFGISFGLALLVKQTALLFLFTPILWVGVQVIRRQKWLRLFQLVVGLLLSVAVFGPWYRTNWLLTLTGSKRATIDSAIAEGDPPLNTLAAWTYYWKELPYQVSWLLLIVPIVGLLLYWRRVRVRSQESEGRKQKAEGFRRLRSKFITRSPDHPRSLEDRPSPLIWLAVFWIGAYLLCSLNINKDDRYVVPYLPVVAVFLAYGLTRWGNRIRWGTVGLAVLLMFLNLFPVGGVLGNGITQVFSPNAQHYAYLGSEFPHTQVIEQIIQTNPYLNSTLGVLPSTAEINQHNLNYYGALRDFQVYARQVGTREKQVDQDARSLDWFLTKTGNQGSVPPAEAAIVQIVEQGKDFGLHESWNLPDQSTLKLYHRRQPSIQVKPLAAESLNAGFLRSELYNRGEQRREETQGQVKLLRITVPPQAPPGVPVPVSYEWSGDWEQLQSGIVLLTWGQPTNPEKRWLHDHGIGMGTLHSHSLTSNQSVEQFQVNEQMAMLPPADLPTGIYTLQATYLNRKTGETYPIAAPPVTLKIDPSASATPAPELDLLTQHRNLATALPQGIKALDRVFEEVARINQYDPIQDYLVQTQLAMAYRLRMEPQNLDWAYTLALSQVLQQRVKGAIAALQRVTKLDSQNPYAYAYLAFVYLYNWDGASATAALKPAFALNPNLPELQALSSIAAFMQGNLVKAWQHFQTFQVISKQEALSEIKNIV